MGRFLVVALVALTVVIGLLMQSDILLYAAGLFFVLALLALVGLALQRSRRRAARPSVPVDPPRSREEELRALGISEIRPRSGPSRPEPAPEPPSEEPPASLDVVEGEVAGGAAATPESGPLPSRAAAPASDPPPRSVLPVADDHPFWQVHSPTALTSFLRALWAATEVQTAVLAVAEEDGTYTLLDARSHLTNLHKEGRLPADCFLRVASAQRPITILTEKDPLVRDLPYYRTPQHVGEVAILPVPWREGRPVYLVADLAADAPPFTERQRALLLGFAELLRTMLAHPPAAAGTRPLPTRRAVIAEEMARARADGRPLALALVYPVEGEAVAERGETAVAEAERTLRLALEDLVHHGRLEPFGELMYGAFLHDDPPTLARWAERVRARAEEDGLPVAVGIACLGEHHTDADALRADAVNALMAAMEGEGAVLLEPDA